MHSETLLQYRITSLDLNWLPDHKLLNLLTAYTGSNFSGLIYIPSARSENETFKHGATVHLFADAIPLFALTCERTTKP